MDKKGLSPVVATVMLLIFVLMVGAILAVVIFGFPKPEPRYEGEFIVENPAPGSDTLRITHAGGPACAGAFGVENSAVAWKNLELRVNGVSGGMKCTYATSGGTPVVKHPTDNSEPSIDLTAGDVFVIDIGMALEGGDEIALVYTPRDQILFLTWVPPA